MRPLLTLFLFLVLAMTSQAQMQKGSWMLDGQFGTNRNKYEESQTPPSGGTQFTSQRGANFYLLPGVGYFIKENWALGLSGDFQYISGKSLNDDGSEAAKGDYRVFGLGLFTRRYIPVGDKVSFFGDLRIGGYLGNSGSIDLDTSERSVVSKRKGLKGTAGVGLQYLVANFVGVHLQSSLIDFQSYKDKPINYEGQTKNSEVTGGLFSSFQVGATFFF